jgi:lipopolysaccharide biosynthesis glycosyltransferase
MVERNGSRRDVGLRSARLILMVACTFLLGMELSNVQQVDLSGRSAVDDIAPPPRQFLLSSTTTDQKDRSRPLPDGAAVLSPTIIDVAANVSRNPAASARAAAESVTANATSSLNEADKNDSISAEATMITPTTKATSGFAIAYVIGGCKPENPVYRNYFYDIAVSVHLMRQEGSIADVIVFVQMSYQSVHDVLPASDLALLHQLRARIIYIAKASNESFYRTMLDKFRILSLTEYDRVLFMDGDVMARGSLDYLYHLSMNGTLCENVVVAGKTEPANGGFFMLAPKADSLDRIMKIIRQKEERGAAMEYPHFNRTIGWGHIFGGENNKDYWQKIVSTQKMTEWKFHGDFADQGLLYQWVKYEEKSVSIIFNNHVENWVVDTSNDGAVILDKKLQLSDIVDNNAALQPIVTTRHCWTHSRCRPPHNDYFHFTGTKKPWMKGPPVDFQTADPLSSPQHYWFSVLHELNAAMGLNVTFDNWNTKQRPLLGLYPIHKHAAQTKYSFET